MKIKRIISCIIACALVISLCACGKKSTEKAQVKSPTELQKYYENYFTSKDVGVAGNNIKATIGNASIELLENSDKTKKMSFSNDKNTYEFYKTIDNKQYVHVVETDEKTEDKNDTWYQYFSSEDDEADKDKKFDIFKEDSSLNFASKKIRGEAFKNIKYLKTEKGIDYLSVSVENNSFVEDSDSSTTTSKLTSSINEVGVDSKTHKIVSLSGEHTIPAISDTGAIPEKDQKLKVKISFLNADTAKIDIPTKTEKCNAEAVLTLFFKASLLLYDYDYANTGS